MNSGGSKTQVTGQVRSQVNRKNIFLPRKLTIFNSKLTRYEKESVIMRGIVYFKVASYSFIRVQEVYTVNVQI